MTKHLPRLDSIRGIAAVMVGGFHAGLFGGPVLLGRPLSWYLSFLFDGRTAVCIFFVLSGLVLGMSLRREGTVTPTTYYRFCGRRFFRLYPAYFTSTLFYLALYGVLLTSIARGLVVGHGRCDCYSESPRLSSLEIVENFLFLNQALNIPSWTLKVEALAALVLPFFHAFSVRFRGKGQMILLAALVGWSFLPDGGSTQINLYLFYLGYLIPQLLEILNGTYFAEGLKNGGWLLVTAISMLTIAHLFDTSAMGHRLGVLFAGLGSMLLLVAIMRAPSHPCFSFLDNQLIRYIGRISYSFYLFNWLSVDLAQRAFYFSTGTILAPTFINWIIVFLASSLLGSILASCSFYLTERPGIRLGNYLLSPKGRSVQPA